MRRALSHIVLFGFVVLVLGGCDEGTNLTIKNETHGVAIVWRGTVEETRLEPGESKTYTVLYFPDTTTYRVTDENGRVLFERTFTFDELEDFGDIVVTSDAPSRSPP